MKELIQLNQIERQLIVYNVFRTFDVVRHSDFLFVLRKVKKRTLQGDIRDLLINWICCPLFWKVTLIPMCRHLCGLSEEWRVLWNSITVTLPSGPDKQEAEKCRQGAAQNTRKAMRTQTSA